MSLLESFSDYVDNKNNINEHEGWVVVGFDKKTRKAEILSIPLIRKEAVRFLQNFEAQLSKMANKFQKYTKLDIKHTSEVFESNIEEDINENRFYIDKNNPYEKITVQLNKDTVVLYAENPFSNESMRFVINNDQVSELIKILNRVK